MRRRDVVARLQGRAPGRIADDPPRPGGRGDHDLNPGLQPEEPLKRAAVLVPLIDHADGLTVMLTKRTDALPTHAGQIAFPGGRMEPIDPDAVAAALRETHEEVGVPPDMVEVVGRLDNYVTRTGYLITPVVGIIAPPYPNEPDPAEVDAVFEVPLSFVLDPRNHERHSRVWKGRERHFYVLPYGRWYIWGATAGMLVNLYEVLAA